MAQWKRIGFKHGECAGSTLLGRRKVRRSNSLLRNFWPEKLPHHRWPSQLTQSCRICLWIKFSKTLSKILLHSTTSTTNTDTFTYYYLYFDLKYTICKINLKTTEISIPDITARTRIVIHILQKIKKWYFLTNQENIFFFVFWSAFLSILKKKLWWHVCAGHKNGLAGHFRLAEEYFGHPWPGV